MPYSYPDNVPDTVKNLPEGAQKLFIGVFNDALDDGKDETEARMAAWGAVKNAYEQKAEGEWVRKAGENVVRYVGAIRLAEDGNISPVQVFRTGTFYHPLYGKFTVTDSMLKTMKANFDNKVRPKPPTEMVVDYDHMSDMGAGPAPAAGWVKSLAARPGALYATVEWTDEAAEQIRSKKFRFISPVWNMDYTDKETNKKVGPTLVAMALTNRPFLEGMEPVVLSDRIERANAMVMALSEKTLEMYSETSVDDLSRAVRDAYYVQFPDEPDVPRTEFIEEIYDGYVIITKGGELFKISYTRDDNGKVTFDAGSRTKVTKTVEYTPVGEEEEKQMAEWDQEYINDLPDDCFAYVAPGGEKDKQGKTVPRSLRHLPFKTPQGNISVDHVKNALARLDQTSLSPEAKAKARAVLEKAAKEAGVGEDNGPESKKGVETMDLEKELRALLGLDEEADVLEAVRELKAKADKTEEAETDKEEAVQAKEKAESDLKAKEVDEAVDKALSDGKILPRQVEWAKNLMGKDPDAFEAYLKTTAKAGPETGVKGSEGGPEGDVQLTEQEANIAARLGVDPKDIIEHKKTQAASA